MKTVLAMASTMALAACAGNPPVVSQKAVSGRYVAMGSSFAAGPGIAPSADQPANRCARSQQNYAHILARQHQLDLVDVSCSAATTAHILGQWNELPPQIDAVTPDTALVTITIGGNDVNFVGDLFTATCTDAPPSALPEGLVKMCSERAKSAVPTPAKNWAELERSFHRINAEIRRRAPRARIVYVNYITLLPDGDLCPAIPISAQSASLARATADQLAALTRQTAQEDGADVVDAAELTKGHDICSTDPWSNGLPLGPVTFPSAPFHPNQRAMEAIAQRLDALLSGR